MAEHPEIDPLLLPDLAARGRAPLVPRGQRRLRRDLDGRGHRPRPGRLRRDGVPRHGEGRSRFYDPLGLVSEGTKIDFQLETNAYLYGTRFMTWLAWQLLARDAGPMGVAQGRQQGLLRDAVPARVRKAARRRWRDWMAFEQVFQQKNLEAIRRYPTTPYADISKHALGSVSRALVRCRDTPSALRRPQLPGAWSATWARSRSRRSVEKLADVKGPTLHRHLRWPSTRRPDPLLHHRQQRLPRHRGARPNARRRTRVLLKDARIGDLAFNRTDRSLWGIRHLQRHLHPRAYRRPLTEWKQVHSWPTATVVVRPRRLARRQARLRLGRRHHRPAVAAGLRHRRRCSRRATRRRW